MRKICTSESKVLKLTNVLKYTLKLDDEMSDINIVIRTVKGGIYMSKKWYFVFVVNTLILVAPYLWLILDIVEHADYNKLLLDVCFAGPCLLLAELLWLFVRK